MATNPSKPLGQPEQDARGANSTETCPAPAPAPIEGAEFDKEDTWMTFGLGADGEEDDRTVTVVFRRPSDEESTEDDLLEPFSPTFPGTTRRR